MKLYDETIKSILEMLSNAKELPVGAVDYPEVSDRSMILRSDMAFELGTERYAGVGSTVFTDDPDLIPCDKVYLLGPDLTEIKADGPYARIAMVLVDDSLMGEGQKLYSSIRNLEYLRYHFYPEGFMMRVSSSKNRESVRIGKDALKNGLNFETIGNMMVSAFKKDPKVKKAMVIYITDPDFDYGKLTALTGEAEGITKTIDHIFNNVIMDCKACNLQEICDEVEGLKELHFAQNKSNL